MNGRRARSDSLHERVRAMVRAFEGQRPLPEPFDALAVDLAAFQATNVPGYGRLCAARGVDPRAITRADEAPAVPADAFRLASVFAFALEDAGIVFRTSGTTLGTRGSHAMRDTRTYDAAALAFGRAMLARDLTHPVPVLIIGPDENDAPDSSLTHMAALFARAFAGSTGAESTFVRAGALQFDALRARVASLRSGEPAIVLATSFALVHVLDALAGKTLDLPTGSRIMQTGGFKGKSRDVSAPELRREVARSFGVSERAIVAEYGMTELSSQFWEATLVDETAMHGVYLEPPWARVVPVDPEALVPVPDGRIGIARIEDLANVDSAWAVLAQDRVRRVPGGFQLLGRAEGAPARGCSIALDEMLSASP
jgi:hypothetical protein